MIYSGFVQADVDFCDCYVFIVVVWVEQLMLFGESVDWLVFYCIGVVYCMSEDVNLKIFQELKFWVVMGIVGVCFVYQQWYEIYELVNGSLSW